VLAATAALALPALPGGSPARAQDPFLRRTAVVRVVERVGPAVVNITTEQIVQRQLHPFAGDPFFDRFFQDFFEPRLTQRTHSLGSGVVIDADRHVLTNDHVVAGAESIEVTLADGRDFRATLIGGDPNNDLAVLQLETQEKVPWIPPGHSSDLMVGEPVIAIGNPFGLSNSVTSGVLSALDRSIRSGDRVFYGFLQTDASINPGNSGGPLLNAEGSLIGINSAIYNGAQGIGFAIPIDTARRVVQELIAHGELTPVWLGLDVQDLSPRLREVLGLPPRLSGVLVSHVRPEGPAAERDVHRGDVVTRLDGHPVPSARDFYDALARATPGQPLRLTLERDGKKREIEIRAGKVPSEAVQELAQELLGLRLKLRPGGGAQVEAVRPETGSARVGIQPGDLVLAIGGRQLADPSSLLHAVLDLRGRARTLVVVVRGRGRSHVTVPLS